ncbi:MAG: EAL domain-containing protein [Pseudomonadota bacterium]
MTRRTQVPRNAPAGRPVGSLLLHLADGDAAEERIRQALALLGGNVQIHTSSHSVAALTEQLAESPELVLLSARTDNGDLAPLVKHVVAAEPPTPCLVIVEQLDAHGMLALMRAGATDCLLHSDLGRLRAVTQSLIESTAQSRQREAGRRALQQSEMHFRSLYDNNPAMLFTLDAEGTVLSANDFGAQQLGLTSADIVGRPYVDLYFPSSHGVVRRQTGAGLKELGGVRRWEGCKRCQNGVELWVRGHGRWQQEADGRDVFLVVCEDHTEAHRLSEKLRHQARYDALTDLLNRQAFADRVQGLVRRTHEQSHTHVIGYLDLDQFKLVNDTCGHDAGDELLKQMAGLMRTKLRSRDTLARIGGDEFGVLLEHCDLDQAERVAQELIDSVARFSFEWRDERFRIGMSIGIAALDDTVVDAAEAIRRADIACLAAKDSGRNCVQRFIADEPGVSQRAGETRWAGRLNKALESNLFELYCQPLVPVSCNRTEGSREPHKHELARCEILLRLVDEPGPPVAPGAFMPVAERFNIAPRIDRWVLENVVGLLAAGGPRVDGIQLCSINLSNQTLGQAEFMTFALDLLGRHEQVAPRLCFEITETTAVRNLAQAQAFIAALRKLGCKFALDDFGSGVATFILLRDLQVDLLKIDGEIVRPVADDPVSYKMVEAINAVGRAMDLVTVAEYVEDAAVLERVREIGIDLVQGFHIAKPRRFGPSARPDLALSIVDGET